MFCAEPIADDDRGIVYGDGLYAHAECEALGIVGHTFGVCSCTGYDTSRASARELARRLEWPR